MALTIAQKPAYLLAPALQDLVYVISENSNILISQSYVKVCCTITENESSIFMGAGSTVGEFKASPNAAGVAMFDFSNIFENYVTPDYTGMNSATPSAFSTMQTIAYDADYNYHPIHCIDKYGYSGNSMRFFNLKFECEYMGGAGQANQIGKDPALLTFAVIAIYNGVVYPTDALEYPTGGSPDYGFNSEKYILQSLPAAGGFITDAPKTQKATLEDFGTFSFFNDFNNMYPLPAVGNDAVTPFTVNEIRVTMYDSSDAVLVTFDIVNLQTNGGYSQNPPDDNFSFLNKTYLLYCGLFPANLRGWSTDFTTHMAATSYYTIQAIDNDTNNMGEEYRINIIEECTYTPIRIAWLNKLGTWDYYTFTKKSTKKLKTKRTTFTRLNGSWNSTTYNTNQQKGGKKNYEVNTTEIIKVNSDFMSEEDGVWMQQLFTAQEMYIVKPYEVRIPGQVVNQFLEPVNLTDSSYKQKTKLNDKLIQYSFSFTRVNTQQTQRP